MMPSLLDTCVVSDLLRKKQPAIQAVMALSERPCVCAVTALELYAGMRSQREEASAERLLASFVMVSIDGAVFRRAGVWLKHYAASHALDIPDALIAATAEHHGLELSTLNLKHFPMFPRLKRPY